MQSSRYWEFLLSMCILLRYKGWTKSSPLTALSNCRRKETLSSHYIVPIVSIVSTDFMELMLSSGHRWTNDYIQIDTYTCTFRPQLYLHYFSKLQVAISIAIAMATFVSLMLWHHFISILNKKMLRFWATHRLTILRTRKTYDTHKKLVLKIHKDFCIRFF